MAKRSITNHVLALARRILPDGLVAQPGVPSAVRTYASRAGGSTVWSFQEGFQEARLVGSLLPNRKAVGVQFSPHGISLVPKAILTPAAPGSSKEAAGGTGASGAPAPNLASDLTAKFASLRADLQAARDRLNILEETLNDEGRDMAETMQMADRTREWRRLKIKKHKINKRRKANRYKAKPAGK